QTSGADLQIDYRWKIPQFGGRDWGHLNFNLDGTYTATYISENEPGSGDKYDCAGFYGATCGTPMPTWRHNLRTTWATPWNFELSALWRYIGSVRSDGDIANVGDTVYGADGKLPAVSYLDLTGSYKFQDRYTLRVGVKNVFDKDPPLVGVDTGTSTYGNYNGNVYTGTYDVLGRQIFVGLTADF
ncbi:MAG: TonB-dependent receptor domain-containing protein, partial [Caulobacteraceae bacterium]